MNQDNSIILNWENVKNVVKIDHFHCFSDILDVYFGWIEQFDMIPSKSCQVSSDTSLEYQQGLGLKCLKSRLPFMNMDFLLWPLGEFRDILYSF